MVDRGGHISIQHVKKIFEDQNGELLTALKDFSLEVKAGSFVSLVGPSGCGKSTLLRMIAGLETPTEGALLLDDQKIEGADYERCLVFQQPTLFPWLDVRGNVASGLQARKVYRQKKADIDRFIRMVGLSGFEKSYPHHLSGGMAQRASLARALVNEPKVLLLDEPLGALDAFTRMHMQDEILRIWQEQQITVILVTHDVDEAIYMSDRIVILSARPGNIQEILDVEKSRPRARNSADFLALRSKILESLHFAGRQNALEYYI